MSEPQVSGEVTDKKEDVFIMFMRLANEILEMINATKKKIAELQGKDQGNQPHSNTNTASQRSSTDEFLHFKELDIETRKALIEIWKKYEEFISLYNEYVKSGTITPSELPQSLAPPPQSIERGSAAQSPTISQPPVQNVESLQAEQPSDQQAGINKDITFIQRSLELSKNKGHIKKLRRQLLYGKSSWPVYAMSMYGVVWAGLYVLGPLGALIGGLFMHRYLSFLRRRAKERLVDLKILNAQILWAMADDEKDVESAARNQAAALTIVKELRQEWEKKVNQYHQELNGDGRFSILRRKKQPQPPTGSDFKPITLIPLSREK